MEEKKPAVSRKLVMVVVIVLIVAIVGGVVAAFQLGLFGQRGPTIELWFNNDGHYGDTEDDVAQVLKSQLEAAGVFEVELKSSAWSQYTGQFSEGELPAFLLGWFPDFSDSDNYVTPFLSTGGAASLGSFYSSAEMDALISNETSGPLAEREQVFSQIQDKLAEDVPYLPLWLTRAHAVYETDVTGVILDPFVFRYYFIGKPGQTELFMSTTDKLTTLDTAIAYDLFSFTAMANVFDNLYITSPTDGTTTPEIIPLLADGDPIAVGGDLSHWRVKLKPNLVFSNGDPITAWDVVFSTRRVIQINDPGSAAFYLTSILDPANLGAALTCPDGDCNTTLTVDFHLKQDYTLFKTFLTFALTSVLNHRVFTSETQAISAINIPAGAGSGPYVLNVSASDLNTRLVLEANPNYNFPTLWSTYSAMGAPTGSVPVSQKFVISIKTDATALRQDIEAHATTGVNLAYRSLNPPDVQALQGRTDLTVLLGDSAQIRYLVFNVQKPPYNDVNLRKAIAYLVDRQELVNTVFGDLAEPLWSMIPPGWFGGKDVFKTVYGETPDVDQAKQLLENVSLDLGFQPAVDLLALWARE